MTFSGSNGGNIMDVETVGNAIQVSAIITIAIVVGIAAIIYAVIKKKKNFDSTGVPKRVEKLDEHEGTTENGGSEWGPGGPVKVVGQEGSAASDMDPGAGAADAAGVAETKVADTAATAAEPGESDHE